MANSLDKEIDMEQWNPTSSLSHLDRSARAAVAAVLITGVLTNPFAPAWLAIIATYPAFTAILGLDPLYGLARSLARRASRIAPTPLPTPATARVRPPLRRTLD